jgi:hypothetical protein
VNKTTYWTVAAIGVVILVVGVLIRSSHHTLGIAGIVVGVIVAVAGVVMALRSGGAGKAV